MGNTEIHPHTSRSPPHPHLDGYTGFIQDLHFKIHKLSRPHFTNFKDPLGVAFLVEPQLLYTNPKKYWATWQLLSTNHTKFGTIHRSLRLITHNPCDCFLSIIICSNILCTVCVHNHRSPSFQKIIKIIFIQISECLIGTGEISH